MTLRLLLLSGTQSRQSTRADSGTYGFGGGGDVLDHHLTFGAQVFAAERRFAFLVQVHVLLETHRHKRRAALERFRGFTEES